MGSTNYFEHVKLITRFGRVTIYFILFIIFTNSHSYTRK